LASDIDVERAKQALERHRLILKQEHDEAALTQAVAGKARAEARLTAAGVSFTA
jgi:F0F1-type ATP synthase epsilon subunit